MGSLYLDIILSVVIVTTGGGRLVDIVRLLLVVRLEFPSILLNLFMPTPKRADLCTLFGTKVPIYVILSWVVNSSGKLPPLPTYIFPLTKVHGSLK